MAQLAFPPAPSLGDIFGRWQFDGAKWMPLPTPAYLQLAGGTMLGPIVWDQPPGADDELVNKAYVDDTIAEKAFFQGVWEVAANTPDLTALTPKDGDYFIAVTADPNIAEVAPAGIAGIGGATITNRDLIYWHSNEWELVRSGVSDVRRFATTITGDGTGTSFTVNHQLGLTDVAVSIYDAATELMVLADVSRVSATAVAVEFTDPPATGQQYRVVVLG